MSGGYPSVPDDRLTTDGWTLRSRSEGAVFRMPGMTVTGYTLLYGDEQLRKALTEAGLETQSIGSEHASEGLLDGAEDEIGRFFFATSLSFQPPLPPGIGTTLVLPAVTNQARQSLTSDLRARGFEQLEWDNRQRLRTESGDRGWLWKCTARLPISDNENRHAALELEGWQAIWTTDGSFRIAGGAYPISGAESVLGALSKSATQFREELLELIRAVR